MGMNVPSKDECYRLLSKQPIMVHIVLHSIQVNRVATLLVDLLARAGTKLNRDLVQAAALLHDITKTRSLQTGENHAQTGADLIRRMGFGPVADIIRQHVRLDDRGDGEPLCEAQIVNYADKRVLHDRIVSLAERMGYIMQRYGTNQRRRRRLRQIWSDTQILEKRIGHLIAPAPDHINTYLDDQGAEQELQVYQGLIPTPDDRVSQ